MLEWHEALCLELEVNPEVNALKFLWCGGILRSDSGAKNIEWYCGHIVR